MFAAFFEIGSNKHNSLFGKFENEFWFNEWEYPRDIGSIIADTESGGYDIIYLDYRECGKDGEPKVSVCFQEYDFEIQVLANNFEEFIEMLISLEELEIMTTRLTGGHDFCVRVYHLIHNQSVKIDIILFVLHNAIDSIKNFK